MKVNKSFSINITVPALFLVVQLLFLLAADKLGVGRTFVNIDYIFAILLAFLRLRILAVVLFAFLFLVDAFMLLVQILPFTRVVDFIYFLSKFDEINQLYTLSFVAVLILGIVLGLILIKLVSKASKLLVLLLFNTGIFSFYFISVLDGTERVDNRFYRVVDVPIVDSVFLYAYNYRNTGFVSTFGLKDQSFTATHYERAFCSNILCDFDGVNKKKYLLVLNESWGAYKNKEINEFFISSIFKEYTAEWGDEGFKGTTIAAELKELCGLETNSFYLKEASKEALEKCLPNRFKKNNWPTYAYHGAVGAMYDREYWYRQAGFENIFFKDSYNWKSRCYSFPGVCDYEIADKLAKDIAFNSSGFFYWLTLNTHHNYSDRDLFIKKGFSCKAFAIDDAEICRNAKLQHQFFLTLKTLLDELKGENLDVFVIGDHVPQVVDTDKKEEVFNIDRVPWLRISLQ